MKIWLRLPALLVSCAGLGFRSMVGASRVLMLLPGLVVLACNVGSPLSWVLFIDLLMLGIWDTMDLLAWRS